MDKFIVSARKYRPQTFDTVVGQRHITTTLKNAILHNQLAHAFLFCGPRGVGKTTCARILAKTINCQNLQPNGEACDTCTSCKSFNEGSSLNIHELDAASNNSVDDIRLLIEQVRFAPQMGRYKVYIIDEVHMLSSSAFNAFLKTLEEPPPYAIFILATTEKHKILPTILSRCQIFDFKRITINDTVEHLQEIATKEAIRAEKTALQVIAQKSEGCMRDALSILDKIVSFTNGEVSYQNTLEHLNILDADYFFKLHAFMMQQQLSEAMLLFDDINRKGFEGDTVLNTFSEFLRNVLVCKDEKVAHLLEVVESFKDKYLETAKNTPSSWIISALNVLNDAEINYKQARNKRLHVELALIKLTYLQQALDLSSGKKKITGSTKAVAFRAIKPIAFHQEQKPNATAPAKLVIEEPIKQAAPVTEAKISTSSQKQAAAPNASARLASLSKIRQQIASEIDNQNPAKPIDEESLQIAWHEYILKLKTSGKNAVVTNFQMMECKPMSSESIQVVCNSEIQLGFLKQERTHLIDFMQQFFHNQAVTISIDFTETIEETLPAERPLTTKDQYLKLIENYPLIKTLKERLNLELDY
ncbi:MAG: DNA polymerase III subunit gamma/tau [Lacibacter sp.]